MKGFVKYSFIVFIILFLITCYMEAFAQSNKAKQQLYQLKIYHLNDQDQEQRVDQYLEEAYLPAMHRAGFETVGVFKPFGQDTTSDRRIYVLVPFNSFDQFKAYPKALNEDEQYLADGDDYINAARDNSPYEDIETILMEAFPLAPEIQKPDLNAPTSERVYELRSYGGPSELLYCRKVDMFNEGGNEIEIFDRLGFNPVFYGSVLAGPDMPNLMYMTSFENMETRDKLWDQFRADHRWEKISSMEKYKGLVTRYDMKFLRAAEYSDI
ncbi:NIPSNAP family protein [Aliifodinibius sp. S!AR15-10]|uniref:NIPSNAP family protein n=1 Tax=Aliifodinibius sp. S!AR15-10 TaxID=2950437 RepID=UPI0028617D95|nr:NIPSNAP family protein [Aliifodinibius sp. S!AR15-10]MDR8393551.1 NIPSNAP family protein [Aliifodinibius sp. S!AR15-10]